MDICISNIYRGPWAWGLREPTSFSMGWSPPPVLNKFERTITNIESRFFYSTLIFFYSTPYLFILPQTYIFYSTLIFVMVPLIFL